MLTVAIPGVEIADHTVFAAVRTVRLAKLSDYPLLSELYTMSATCREAYH